MTEINTSPFRRTLYESGGWRNIQQALMDNRITSVTHPNACDLFAGDGGGAYALVKSGWLAKNIVCVDFKRPPDPLIAGAVWVYGDLRQLLDPGPEGIIGKWETHQGRYDVVIAVNAWWTKSSRGEVVQFFLAPGGYVYT